MTSPHISGILGEFGINIWGLGIALLFRAGYCSSAGGEEMVILVFSFESFVFSLGKALAIW